MAHATGKATHVPVRIEADLSVLSASDRETLELLIQAAHVINEIFLDQMRQHLLEEGTVFTSTPVPAFYPSHTTKEEIETFLDANPDRRSEILSPYTVVVRSSNEFRTIPYAEEYQPALETISALLRHASDRTDAPRMKAFLKARAEAFETNEYRASDIAWIHANDAPFEITIGAYESYADTWFGRKQTFESILGLVLQKETAEAHIFKEQLVRFDQALGARYGYTASTTLPPMVVIDEVLGAGECLYSFIPMAFNLPNDRSIHAEAGSKKVFIRNVMRAKLENITRPIAARIFGDKFAAKMTLEDMLRFVIGHEGSRGLTFSFEGEYFEAYHSGLEEGKADVFGIVFLYFLLDAGILTREMVVSAVIGHIADLIRQVRFGLTEAHAIGALVQFNWLSTHGAITLSGAGIELEPSLFRSAFTDLGDMFYELWQTKSVAEATSFLDEWATIPPVFETLVESLIDIPVDIDPIFTV